MVGADLIRDIGLAVLVVRNAGHGGDLFDDGLKQIALKITPHTLHHGGQALQPHTGVDGGFGKRRELSGLVAVVLHEHQVPDFKIPVAVATHGTARFAAGHFGTLVNQDLGTRSARPGIAHGPEIVFLTQPHNPVRSDAGHLLPEFESLIVVLVHRDPEFIFRQFDLLGQELPGEGNGVLFKIVAKGKVAEHLKKRMMPRSVAYVFEIIVFSACTNAFLRCGGAFVIPNVFTQKQSLELDHARVRKQKRRIVFRHERRARHNLVPPRCKIVDKQFP